MACQSTRKHRIEGLKWTVVIKLQLLAVLLGEVVAIASAMSVGDNSVGFAKQGFGLRRLPYKSLSLSKQQQHQQQQQQQRRLKQTGNEIIPAVGANDISDEPTCEELRAMWRYYKRQSRAELTNEIPQFGKNPFFEMLPGPPRNPVFASFGLGPKGRNKNRMRPQNHLYGRVVHKPSKSRERGGGRNRNSKPFELVRDLMRNPSGSSSSSSSSSDSGDKTISQTSGGAAAAAAVASATTTPPSAIVHYSPPAIPARESSFQKLKGIISNERMREKGPTRTSSSSTDNREFGKIILSPPRGQDGRRINKPLERMTPFEKIRFGHADDLLDEGIRRNLDVMKRRTLPLSVLKTQWKQQKQQQQQHQPLEKRRFLSNPILFLTPSSSSSSGGVGGGSGDQSTTFSSSKYFDKRTEENNNNIIAQTNDKQQLDSLFENENVPSQLTEDNPTTLFGNNDNNNNVIINNGDYTDSILDGVPSSSTAQSKYTTAVRQTVEMPTCVEVEHEPCNQTSDCSCIGFALYRCYLNQCQILPLAFSVQDELPSEEEESSSSSGDSQPDIWHSEPLPSEKLGIWEDPIVDVESNSAASNAARLSTIRARKNIRNEGKSNARLTDTTYLVLQGKDLYT